MSGRSREEMGERQTKRERDEEWSRGAERRTEGE